MKTSLRIITVLTFIAISMPLSAHVTEEKTPAPGFRPECEGAASFAAEVKTSSIRVYPTIVRTPTNTTFSTESQQQIVDYLKENKVTHALSDDRSVDPGELKGVGQFQWFQNDCEVIGKEVQTRDISEPYILVMEVLFPPSRDHRLMVFGIHCIVLDSKGENAFSYLLNIQHQMFVDANLRTDDSSDKSRKELIQKATQVGLEALPLQLHEEEHK